MLDQVVEATTRAMTAAEFLAWEERQGGKWEFDGLQPVAMTGATYAHNRVQANLIVALGSRLRGRPCQPCGPDMRVPTAGGARFRYPDALVSCRPLPPDARDEPEPVVLFEVLSPSTEGEDNGTKLEEYLALPSLRRYVMLRQDRAHATIYERRGEDWYVLFARNADAVLAMPEIGIASLPLEELYANVPMLAASDGAAVV